MYNAPRAVRGPMLYSVAPRQCMGGELAPLHVIDDDNIVQFQAWKIQRS